MKARQLVFLSALRTGNVMSACIACDVGMDELKRWRRDAEFKAAMDEAKAAWVATERARLAVEAAKEREVRKRHRSVRTMVAAAERRRIGQAQRSLGRVNHWTG